MLQLFYLSYLASHFPACMQGSTYIRKGHYAICFTLGLADREESKQYKREEVKCFINTYIGSDFFKLLNFHSR